MTTPSNGITTGISARSAYVSEQSLDQNAEQIIKLTNDMDGNSCGNDLERTFDNTQKLSI